MKCHRILWLVLTVMVCASIERASAQAAAQTPAAPLPAGVQRVTSVEGITEYTLANGLRVLLFPDRPGEMTAFGFVQHNFFVLFNAATGLLFLRRATRELFAEAP